MFVQPKNLQQDWLADGVEYFNHEQYDESLECFSEYNKIYEINFFMTNISQCLHGKKK